jgi:hypothetical protein
LPFFSLIHASLSICYFVEDYYSSETAYRGEADLPAIDFEALKSRFDNFYEYRNSGPKTMGDYWPGQFGGVSNGFGGKNRVLL